MELSAYRIAYEAANSEFRVILKEFNQLSLRKGQLEKAVEALRPLARFDAQSPATEQCAEDPALAQVQQIVQQIVEAPVERIQLEEPPSEPAQPAVALTLDLLQQFEELEPGVVREDEEVSSDPIQRRIDSALKHRSSFRGIREYCHGFGAGL